MVFSILRAFASRRPKSSNGKARANRHRYRAVPRVEELENRLVPAVYFVDTLDDTHDADLTNMAAVDSNGNTSLRAAIEQANTGIGHNDIEFASGLTGTIELTLGKLLLDDDIAIFGPGYLGLMVLRPATAQKHSIFEINIGKDCEISGLTIAGGDTNTAGGGIENYGTLYLDSCLLWGNQAFHGGAVANFETLTVMSCLVWDNTAVEMGGGFYNSVGTLGISNTQFLGNSAKWGGGIFTTNDSNCLLDNCLIDDNFASEDGGGIYNDGAAEFVMISGRLKENRANKGGGIFSKDGFANLGGVAIIDNEAFSKGGGFYIDSITIIFSGCFIDGNSALDLGPGGAWKSPGTYINNCVINDIIQEDTTP